MGDTAPLSIQNYTNPNGEAKLEMMGIKLRGETEWLNLAVCYNPDQSVTQEELEHYFLQIPQPSQWHQSCSDENVMLYSI